MGIDKIKMELQSALEEAEATLEQEENKVLRCQLELNAVRQEIERRLAEKEEEFILVKKAQSKALDSMQVALETETKSKAEALRMKQELADTNETLADLTNVNQSITASKRKLEGELGQLNADLDEMTNEARLSEDKAARAMVDAARL